MENQEPTAAYPHGYAQQQVRSNQGNFNPATTAAQRVDKIQPSVLNDLESQSKIIGGLEEDIEILGARLQSLMPQGPDPAGRGVPAPPGRDRLYSSAGSSVACEIASNANDRLMELRARVQRLSNRVEL